jgi:CHASE2 domain-containing sensor protein
MRYLAQTVEDTFGRISPPPQISNLGTGSTAINSLLDNTIGLFFAAGSMAFILMFVWGAVQMILSGGDKEAVSKAKSKITWAIIGVTLLAMSYTILYLIQTITGFKFFVSGP